MGSGHKLMDTSDVEDAENSGQHVLQVETKNATKNWTLVAHKNSTSNRSLSPTSQNNSPCSEKGATGNFHDSEKRQDISNASRYLLCSNSFDVLSKTTGKQVKLTENDNDLIQEKQVSPPTLNSKLSPEASVFVPKYVIAKKNESRTSVSNTIDLGEDSLDEDEEDNMLDLGEDSLDEDEEDMLDICFDRVAREGDISARQQRSESNKSKKKTHGRQHSWDGKMTEEFVSSFGNQHFPSSKQQRISDIEHQVCLCIEVLESVPQEKRELNHERAIFEYLKGRFYNAIPDVYKEEAERHLVNATRLNPRLRDAWHCLGSCFVKKGHIHRAKRCYQTVLEMGEESSIILHKLADLELKFARVSENPAKHIEQSIKYAQRMLVLDDKDGICLYILGCAHFTSFLLTGGRDHNNLQLALEAYEKAKKIVASKANPHLEYDCSMVNRYLENYKMSLIGFSDAASMNPTSDALHQMKLTLQLLDKLEGLLQSYQGKLSVSCYNIIYYMLCDSDENSFVLIAFGILKEAIKQGDQVTVLEPICKFIDFEWEGKHYQFKSVRVNLLE
ncbi:hypothetical protein MTR67_007886 [Solanum verrucosum]|uniref:Tetratricopeptide repeat protein 5 OB fold domain-containing protein n=1 Tax=Solanum verrucosum TaxID=315347 RepID=A0AAF0Q5V0_SOLVR|nr:hypothetical protein MTR67_007886 [Solanum verrucosum]